MVNIARTACAVSLNLAVILVLWTPIYLINRYLEPQIRGFDPSNSANALPFKADTVKPLIAGLVSLATAIFPIVLLEFFIYFKSKPSPSESEETIGCTSYVQSTWSVWVAVGRLFAVFFAGYSLTGVTTDIVKYMVARPRPSFLHMCQPDYTKYEQCKPCGSPVNPVGFWPLCPDCPYIPPNISTIICQQTDWWISRNMWLSFPSGHASYTAYAGWFLAVYLFKRLATFPVIVYSFVTLRPIAVFVAIAFSLFVGLTRISDDRHHVTDVVGGAGIGIFLATFCALFVAFPSLQKLPAFHCAKCDGPSKSSENLEEANNNDQECSALCSKEAKAAAAEITETPLKDTAPEKATPF